MRAHRLLLLLLAAAALWTAAPSAQNHAYPFSGRVTSASGAPLAGVRIIVCPSGPAVCGETVTDAAGYYSVTNRPMVGTYAATSNSLGFIDEIYDNIPCPGDCDVSEIALRGRRIPVVADQVTTGIDFVLEPGGTIAGAVRRSGTSSVISGVLMQAFARTSTGPRVVRRASTDASGSYSLGGLPAGTHYVATANSLGFINEVANDVRCLMSCTWSDAATGAPIAVTVGATTALDFALDLGGTITGTITGDGAPLSSGYVQALTRSGAVIARAGQPDSRTDGTFTIRGLPTGSYYLLTTAPSHVNEIFDNIPCLGECSPSIAINRGTAIAVSEGQTAAAVHLSLDRGGTISGTVRVPPDSPGEIELRFYTRSGEVADFAGSARTTTTGLYSIGNLPSGIYYAHTASGSVRREIFDDIPCVGECEPETVVRVGTPIAVTQGATTSGRDFTLTAGGQIWGSVSNAATTAGIAGVAVRVYAAVQNGYRLANTGLTDAVGHYRIGGLPTGRYYVSTAGAPGFTNEIFDNIPCPGTCVENSVIGAGVAVDVVDGAPYSTVNFALDPAGGIGGTVRDAATGVALSGVSVQVVRKMAGVLVTAGSASTDSAGAYLVTGLSAGTYYAYSADTTGYVNQIFQNVSCAGTCDAAFAVATGAPITVGPGVTTSGRDFSLRSGGTISGRVIHQTTDAAVAGAAVHIVARAGQTWTPAGSATTNPSGVYAVAGLPAGTYYAYTSAIAGFVPEIFDNVSCRRNCQPFEAIQLGAPIVVAAGSSVSGRDFALAPIASLDLPDRPTRLTASIANATATFNWDPSSELLPPSSYVLEAGFAPGHTAVTVDAPRNRYVASGLPPGRFFVRVRARNAAGLGPPSAEYEFVVNADGSAMPDPPTDVTAYMVGTRLYLSWSQPSSGGVATGYVVEAGTASGLANIAVLPVGARPFFTFDPVPPGFYFLRVRAFNAASVSRPSNDIMLTVGEAPAPPGAPFNVGALVSAARTVTIGWASPGGTVTSYVLEAGSARGLSNIGVFNTGSAETTIAIPNVPPGTYWIRLRAANALGAGLPSSEVPIVVP